MSQCESQLVIYFDFNREMKTNLQAAYTVHI